MQKYNIQVRQIYYADVQVTANSESEALALAAKHIQEFEVKSTYSHTEEPEYWIVEALTLPE